MNLKNALKNPYIQGAILILGLILYLLSPNDAFRLLTGAIVAITIIGLVVLEIKEGAKQQGWKHEIKDTVLTLIAALILWFAAQFVLNTSSPISAVVTCSMLPNLQRGDFAIVQGASPSAYEIEMTKNELDELYGDSKFYANGQNYSVKGSLYSYCAYIRPEFCKEFVATPEKFPETKGSLTFHYSSCTMDIKNKGKMTEPCVTSVEYKEKIYPVNTSNEIIVYQPDKNELYSLSGDIIHRAYFKIKIKETGEYYYLTKGDNNPILDIQAYDYMLKMGNEPIYQKKIKGKMIFKVPLLGYYKLLISGFFTEPPQCSMQLEQK